MISGALSSLGRRVGQSIYTLYGAPPGLPSPAAFSRGRLDVRDRYRLLREMYQCNGLYEDSAQALRAAGIWRESLKPLRTCVYRVVEFYVSKVWPGSLPDALPIVTAEGANAAIVPAIEQVWRWSNWASQKQVFIRWLGMYGDVFVKVATRAVQAVESVGGGDVTSDRVYFQLIDPQHVMEFDTDERGYLTYIRIDVPQARRTGDRTEEVTFTEVWDKAKGTRRRWEHTRGDERDLERLGAPKDETPLAAFGIDFLPFVHCMFRDVGEPRGQAAVTHAIDKIDEANRMATRLHQQLFRGNTNTWVLEGSGVLTRDGRSVPPPRVEGMSGSTTEDGGTVTVGDDQLVPLPSGWTIKSMVPDLRYADALEILNAHMTELEHDLPELTYYRLKDLPGEASGRSVRLRMANAIDNVIEVRGNAEAALIRLHEMALTIGAEAGLFDGIGTYQAGDFAHDIARRDVLPADRLEEAQARQAEVNAAIAEQQVTDPLLLKRLGYTDAEIAEREAGREATTADAAERMLAAIDRGA